MPARQSKQVVVAKIPKKRRKAHAHTAKQASCGGEDKQEKRKSSCPRNKASMLQVIPVEKISVVGVLEKHISSAAVEIPVRFENSILVRVLSSGELGVLTAGKEIRAIRRGNAYGIPRNIQPEQEQAGEFIRIKDVNRGDLIELIVNM